MEIILECIPKNGKLIFYNPTNLMKYCLSAEGKEHVMSLKPSNKSSEKQKMQNYLRGPLIDCAIIGFTNAGYWGMDEDSALQELKEMFLTKTIILPDGREKRTPMSIGKINKERLLKFLQDCCFFIESELQQEIPDSVTWREYKITGKNFKSVKNLMPNKE